MSSSPEMLLHPPEALGVVNEAADHFKTQVLQMATFFKHPSFSEEREWRVVRTLQPGATCLSFRTGKVSMIPYTSFPLKISKSRVIREIVVGPTPQAELAFAAVQQFVKRHFSYDVAVRLSGIPYRAF